MSNYNHDLEKDDEVNYLPDELHAFHRDHNGDYTWVIGVRKRVPVLEGTPGQTIEHIQELSTRELDNQLKVLRRHPNPNEERKKFVLLRPAKPWKGVVTQVNDDGTVNLDIEVGNGFTLHYDNVKVDQSKNYTHKNKHTCHPIESKSKGKSKAKTEVTKARDEEAEQSEQNKQELEEDQAQTQNQDQQDNQQDAWKNYQDRKNKPTIKSKGKE